MVTIDYKKLGKRLRELRKSKGLSQQQLAELVEVGSSYISHVEVSIAKPSLDLLFRLSVALDVSMDYFLLDTPYIPSDILINKGIGRQLSACDKFTLQTVSRMIDLLLDEQQARHRAES